MGVCLGKAWGGVGSQGTGAASWEAASAFAPLSPVFSHVGLFLPHSWPWVCLRSWSAGGIIRVRFSIKMCPDVLLIAETNIPPA